MRKSLRPLHRRKLRIRGQSIVEFALMLPILLIILSGLFEFGFMFTSYLAILDAARNASRFASDSQFDTEDIVGDCDLTRDFFRQTSCLALQELTLQQPTIALCTPESTPREHCSGTNWDEYDDIIISVFSVTKKGHPASQFPEVKRWPNPGIGTCDEYGWSYLVDMQGGHGPHSSQCAFREGIHVSQFTKDEVELMLKLDAPNTAFVMVEIHYHHWQILALPWFTQFVGDPIPFHVYAVWPLSSAEPTSTG